jgi:hypothetical protein
MVQQCFHVVLLQRHWQTAFLLTQIPFEGRRFPPY